MDHSFDDLCEYSELLMNILNEGKNKVINERDKLYEDNKEIIEYCENDGESDDKVIMYNTDWKMAGLFMFILILFPCVFVLMLLAMEAFYFGIIGVGIAIAWYRAFNKASKENKKAQYRLLNYEKFYQDYKEKDKTLDKKLYRFYSLLEDAEKLNERIEEAKNATIVPMKQLENNTELLMKNIDFYFPDIKSDIEKKLSLKNEE